MISDHLIVYPLLIELWCILEKAVATSKNFECNEIDKENDGIFRNFLKSYIAPSDKAA